METNSKNDKFLQRTVTWLNVIYLSLTMIGVCVMVYVQARVDMAETRRETKYNREEIQEVKESVKNYMDKFEKKIDRNYEKINQVDKDLKDKADRE